ncbi:MAG: RluA family pseudouridine synthase [Urechidicola sp.]|nr:RluA family pseudouridine synthase [Urechidicola sp.]
MILVETHIVPIQNTPIRLQEYLVGVFATASTKSALKKAIKKELIFVDNKPTTTAKMISGGEIITLLKSEEVSNLKQFNLKLTVAFEDDYLAVVDKPAGILVSGNSFKTIANALTQSLQLSSQFDACKPQPVHRLDFPTTGLLLIGKTSSAILKLNQLFEKKEIQKIYCAITIGKMNKFGSIDIPVDEKEATSDFEVLQTVVSKRFAFLNLVKLIPKTGRRHQLRKHLSAIGNPILGDKEYGKENLILMGKGLYLHASNLEFIHPFTKEKMNISIKNPTRFLKIFP